MDRDSQPETSTCPNCGTRLIGRYCHACGQERLVGTVTLRWFFGSLAKRVYRFDKAFAVTIARALRAPGELTQDYVEGRRGDILDPFHFFISSVFVQFVIASITRFVARISHDPTLTHWLGRVGGVVALKALVIVWLGAVWRLLFKPRLHTLGEGYVFATYSFATAGLLWSLLPLLDMVVPVDLGANPLVVACTVLGIELIYLIYGLRGFTRLPLWQCIVRATMVLSLGYGALVLALGLAQSLDLIVPPMPLAWPAITLD